MIIGSMNPCADGLVAPSYMQPTVSLAQFREVTRRDLVKGRRYLRREFHPGYTDKNVHWTVIVLDSHSSYPFSSDYFGQGLYETRPPATAQYWELPA